MSEKGKKAKVKRQSVRMDMTAMCDVAFLLLTFFILTTKFRPNEPVQVDIPASTAQIPIPEKDILMISVDPKGRIFFGVDDQNTRLTILSEIATAKGFTVDGAMQKRFTLLDQFGVPLAQLPSLLKLDAMEMAKFVQPGIKLPEKIDEKTIAENELAFLIVKARTANPNLRIAVKADKAADYSSVNSIIETFRLKGVNSNRFNLITSAKGGGASTPAPATK